MSTHYRMSSRSLRDGGAIKLEEKAASPGAPFGAPGNQRSVSTFHPFIERDPSSGQLKSTQRADGSLTTYTYQSGDYSGGEAGVPGDFQPRVGGPYTRLTQSEGSVDHPQGQPQKSVTTETIQSPTGKVLLEEKKIQLRADPTQSETITWIAHGYDELDRKTLTPRPQRAHWRIPLQPLLRETRVASRRPGSRDPLPARPRRPRHQQNRDPPWASRSRHPLPIRLP